MTPMLTPTDAPARLNASKAGQSPPSVGAPPAPTAEPIAGRVLLADGDDVACTVLMHSPLRGEVRAQGRAACGEVVVCALDNVGILVGKVFEVGTAGFGVAFMVKDGRREKLAARLEWHAAQSERSARLRGAPRIVPIHRAVEVHFAETMAVAGTILNVSLSGAAIALQPDPGLFVGSLVRIGARLATVMRPIAGGVAVQFVQPFAPDIFDERIRL